MVALTLLAPAPEVGAGTVAPAGDGGDAPDPPGQRRYRKSWAALLAQVFSADLLTCSHCGTERSILAAITDRDVVVKILNHLELPTDVPDLAPARAPPQTGLFSDDDWPVA